MKYRAGFALGCLCLSAVVQAIEPGPSSRYQAQTEAWLQLQPQGQQRTPTPQVASPSERELALQRWLDSYKHPIPDFYKQDEGGSLKGK